MKFLLLTISAVLLANPAQAATKKLLCTTGSSIEVFEATLVDAAVDGSSFSGVRDAGVTENYASASLICAGHRLEGISCVGFWFNQGKYVAQVETSRTAQGIVAIHKNLTPAPVANGEPWKCEVR